jgi:putative lipoprotein
LLAATSGHPAGRWLAENIRGGGVIDRLQTILEVGADGAVSGTGGCSVLRGRVIIVPTERTAFDRNRPSLFAS